MPIRRNYTFLRSNACIRRERRYDFRYRNENICSSIKFLSIFSLSISLSLYNSFEAIVHIIFYCSTAKTERRKCQQSNFARLVPFWKCLTKWQAASDSVEFSMYSNRLGDNAKTILAEFKLNTVNILFCIQFFCSPCIYQWQFCR